MAEVLQPVNRGRAALLFVVGLLLLVGLLLGGLYVSGQRGNVAQTGTSEKVAQEAPQTTEEPKKPQGNKDSSEQDKKQEKQDTPAKKKEEKPKEEANQGVVKPEKDEEKSPPSMPTTGPSGAQNAIPATGPADQLVFVAIPVLLVIAYVAFEFRRSRQAVQRAAFHENPIL